MRHHSSICTLSALLLTFASAAAFDDAMYPDWKGQWSRIGGFNWDPTKPRGGQQAPLTAEYQALHEASMANQVSGGQGNYQGDLCVPYGMPGMMLAYLPMEFIITPDITYIALEHMSQFRRIYTDGRAWPKQLTPAFNGYSIGQWLDEDRDGRYDALVIETRGMKGPRSYDSSGLPLHSDNATIVKERLSLDKAEPGRVLHNEITTIDHALTRPWTVTRSYRRVDKPVWVEHNCEDNRNPRIGDESYFISVDGHLMPTRKDQPPPRLRGFDQGRQ
jgi:hypothetical protein